MVWGKSKQPKEEKTTADSDNNVLVRQDPRTRVKTATAQTESTKTTVQNSTTIDHTQNRIIKSTTHQTVTLRQRAGVTELVTRRTPTASELESMFPKGTFTETTVTRHNGVHETSFVNEQRVKVSNAKATPSSYSFTGTTFTTNPAKPSSTTSTNTSLTPFKYDTAPNSTLRSRFFDTSNLTAITNSSKPLTQVATTPAATSFKSTLPDKSSSIQSTKARLDLLTRNTAASKSFRGTSNTPSYSSPYANRLNSTLSTAAISSKPKDDNKLYQLPPLKTSYSTPTVRGPLASSFKTPQPAIVMDAKLTNPPYDVPQLTALNPPKPTWRTSSDRPREKLEPGHAVIINSVNFKNRDLNRLGSDRDAQRIQRTLMKFKLKVKEHKDPKLKEIDDIVKNIKKKNYTKCACLVIVILSHGNQGDNILAYDGEYNIDKTILQPILTIPSLMNKPKIFIVQACKGNITPGEFKTDAVQLHAPPIEILKCYSTYEGYVSYRTAQGSPFIEALCDELEANGMNSELVDIMRKVIEQVKQRTNSKQIPSLTSTLTKPFIFGQHL